MSVLKGSVEVVLRLSLRLRDLMVVLDFVSVEGFLVSLLYGLESTALALVGGHVEEEGRGGEGGRGGGRWLTEERGSERSAWVELE